MRTGEEKCEEIKIVDVTNKQTHKFWWVPGNNVARLLVKLTRLSHNKPVASMVEERN